MPPVEERVNKKSVVLRDKDILLEHDVENKGLIKSPLLQTENHILLLKECYIPEIDIPKVGRILLTRQLVSVS